MKKHITILILFFCFHSQAQTYLKGNVFTTLLSVPNIGIETSIGKKSTFQFDITASFWKSISGNPREFYLFIPEYRYHFKEKDKGFYLGANIGGTLFNFQKWNYLNTNLYEKGLGYLIGATIGYKAKINEKWGLDCFLSGGWHQGFYKGHYIGTDIRYESVEHYNKSGEWLPYRGGVMISYKLN